MYGPITVQESARRLSVLASFLDNLEEDKFTYSSWGQRQKNEEVDKRLLAIASNAPEKNLCGTTACALGWATAIDEFKEMGLHLETWWAEDREILIPSFSVRSSESGLEGLDVATHTFGVSYAEAEFLFTPNWYLGADYTRQSPPRNATAKDVAEHIRLFVQKYRKSA